MKIFTNVETLRNLHNTLGITEVPPQPHGIPVRGKNSTTKNSMSKLGYFKFAERVNGRVAMSGMVIAKAIYKYNGQELYEQIHVNQDNFLFLSIGLMGTIMGVSLITHNSNMDSMVSMGSTQKQFQVAEIFEGYLGRWFMFFWLINIIIN